MEPFVQVDPSFYVISDWVKNHENLVVGFTTKHGGIGSGNFASMNLAFHVGDSQTTVCRNRQLLSEKLEFPLHNWVSAEQTHETKICKVTKNDCGKGAIDIEHAFKQTDGFYTFDTGILLTLCYADCVPLFFIAPKARLIGIAHAGWRGTVNEIGANMVSQFQREGIELDEIQVVIGPSICKNCYIVDDSVIAHVQNKLEDVKKNTYNLITGNQYQLNLPLLNKQILVAAGVKRENIQMTHLCTSCHHNVFFSHRKDKGSTGRMLSFIGWKEV